MPTDDFQSHSKTLINAQSSFGWEPHFADPSLRDHAKDSDICVVSVIACQTPTDPILQDEEWSEEELVLLHWRLLQDINRLADPRTPLEEKFYTLRWVFTERENDAKPFSFVSCLRVVGCSPLSPITFCGLVDSEEIRDRIQTCVPQWLNATLERYPIWVREAVRRHPDWVEAQLNDDPQCINEELDLCIAQGDLFHA